MNFGVIYTVDIPIPDRWRGGMKLSDFHPKVLKHKRGVWRQTEKSDNPERDSYGAAWRHAKFCALLTKEELKEFLNRFGFTYHSRCETMGAMGMPGGVWYGCSPAWSFDGDGESEALLNIYLTPWPEVEKKTGVADSEKNWKNIKLALECVFP